MSIHHTIPSHHRHKHEQAQAETDAWLAAGNEIDYREPWESGEHIGPVSKKRGVGRNLGLEMGSQQEQVYQALKAHGKWIGAHNLTPLTGLEFKQVRHTLGPLVRKGYIRKRHLGGGQESVYKAVQA